MVITSADRHRISEAIKKAESKTQGQIVPMVVRRSDTYPGVRWRIAVAMGFLASGGLYFFMPWLDGVYYLLIQIPGLLLGHALASFDSIQRLLISSRHMTTEVHRHAIEAFYLHASKTEHHTGILIFVSVLEHRAIILADSGIHSRVKDGTWDHIITKLLSRIRTGSLADGLCEAVLDCGKILSEHFPARDGTVNELPDRVITKM